MRAHGTLTGPATDQERPLIDTSIERRRLELIAEAGALLSSSLDERKVLEQLAGFVVAGVGDWCSIDLVDQDVSEIDRVVVTHREPRFADAAQMLRAHPPSVDPTTPFRIALDTRTTQVLEEVPDELLQRAAADEEHFALMRSLRITAGLVVPMIARGKLIGALSIAWTGPAKTFTPQDVVFAEELARRGAIAVDNARLLANVRESDERYRGLVDHLDAIVWELDALTGEVRYVSPSVQRILGYPPEDGAVRRALIPPGLDIAQLATILQRGGEHAELEFPATTAEGHTLWLHGRFYRDASGPSVAIRALAVDVTERKAHEREVTTELAVTRVFSEEEDPSKIPERVMREILQGLGWEAAGLWVQSADGTLRCEAFETVQVGAFQSFAEVSRALSMPVGVGLPGRVWESAAPAWIEDVAKDPNFPRAQAAVEVGLHGAFGFPVVVAGRVIAMIELFATESRRREEHLLEVMGSIGAQMGQFVESRRSLAALRLSEARMRAVVDSALDCVVGMTPDGRIVEFNPAAEATFGYRREDAVGRHMAELIVPPELRERHLRAVQRYLTTGTPTILGQRLRISGMRSDGTVFPVELAVIALGEPPEMFIGFLRDMTRWRDAERRREAQIEVSRALAESDTLDELSARVLESIAFPLGWQLGAMWLSDAGGEQISCRALWRAPELSADDAAAGFDRPFRRGEGLIGRAWADARAAWIQDLSSADDYLRHETAQAAGFHSMIVFPIGRPGSARGVVEFYTHEKLAPDEDLLAVLGVFGRQVAGAIERIEAADALQTSRAILASQSEASADAIIVVASTGEILYRNHRFDELFGLDERDARDPIRILDVVLSALADRTAGEAGFDRAFADASVEIRQDLALKEGRFVELHSVGLSTADADAPFARAWYFRDITERKRTERILRESTERAAFLAEAGGVLMRSLDVRETVASIVRQAVPALGSLCQIDLLDGEHGPVMSIGHGLGADLVPPLSHEEATARGAALRTRSILWRARSGAVVAPGAPTAAVPGHEGAPYVCTPLRARGHVLGVMTVLVGERSRDVDRSLVSLVEDLAWRVGTALDNAMLHAERSAIARSLQESLLPPELPAIPGLSLAARYRASRAGMEIGGDFYDVFETARDDWALVMGDVSGKGAEAAKLTALARYTIRAAVMSARRPRFVLHQLNEAILREGDHERFATVAYVRLRRPPTGWRMTVAAGGHPLPILVRSSGRTIPFGAPGTLIGALPEVSLVEKQGRLSPGDTIVLYTDGVTEARRGKQMFGEEGLREVLSSVATESPGTMVDAVIDTLDGFRDGAQADDIAIVAARVDGGGATSGG